MAETPKTKRIAKKRKELMEVFKSADANKLKTAEALIDRASFIIVSLEDLELEIAEDGWVETYQNGEKQSGKKKSAAADAYISLTKNLSTITKQLIDLCPAEVKQEGKLAMMMRG